MTITKDYSLLRPSGNTPEMPKLFVTSTPQYRREYCATAGCYQTDEVRDKELKHRIVIRLILVRDIEKTVKYSLWMIFNIYIKLLKSSF